MASCRSCIFITTLVMAVGVGLLMNIAIPEGFQEPLTLRLGSAAYRIMRFVGDIIYSPEENMKILRNMMADEGVRANLTGVKTRDTGFNGVDVRLYMPDGASTSDAAIIYYHGGGWVLGSYNGTPHITMAEITRRLKITVVSVEYRLAPEHPFPTPFEDCVAATKYFLENAANYGVSPDRVALMGDSAGGNLAAAVSLSLRDESYDYQPKLQVLLYPALQAFDFLTPSYQLYQNEALLYKELMLRFWLWYAFGDLDDIKSAMINMHTSPKMKKQVSETKFDHRTLGAYHKPANYKAPNLDIGNASLWEEMAGVFEDPYYAPLMADDLTDLPQTYILTAEHDVLRDDGIWYAQRLRAADNEVTHEHMDFMFHALLSTPGYKDYHLAWEKVCQYVEKHL